MVGSTCPAHDNAAVLKKAKYVKNVKYVKYVYFFFKKMRRALLTKGSDSSLAEAHSGILSEPTHIEGEVEDQEDEVEDEGDCEECKVESRREGRHTSAHMDGMTRTTP